MECALKACIAKQVQKHEFPDKTTVQKSHVHDLEKLLGVAGLRTRLDADARTNQALEVNWSVVKDWSSESRYLRSGSGKLNSLYKWMTGFNALIDNGRAGDLHHEQIIRTTYSSGIQR